MSTDERRRLRAVLVEVAPWLEHSESGPQTVDAGQCDRCGDRPRLVPTCGPARWRALCRACTVEVGGEAWCAGHLEEGRALLLWAADLPVWWGDAVVLWWVATGEVTAPPTEVAPGLPAPVRAALQA